MDFQSNSTCLLSLSEADIKNNKIRFTPCGRSFFPKEAFGGRTKNELGELLTFNVQGVGQIKTDLPVDKDGNPRWFCRERKWVKEFISTHALKPNSKIEVLRQSQKTYRIKPLLGKPKFIDLFAGMESGSLLQS